MSIPQGAEISLAYADFLSTRVDNLTDIRWGPAYSSGTRLLARDARGVWRAYLLTDLTSPPKVNGSAGLISQRTTMSLTAVSTGAGIIAGLTPRRSGIMYGSLTAICSNDTAGDGMRAEIRYNTTGVPALGADATVDTLMVNTAIINNASISAQQFILDVTALKTPFTLGTKYYFYISFAALVGGTVTMYGGGSRMTLFEL